jgi:hypothetical protein
LQRYAESGVDEAFFDAFAVFTSLDQMLDFASQVIARTGRLGPPERRRNRLPRNASTRVVCDPT